MYDKDKDPNFLKYTPETLIERYNLIGHIEGGYFSEVYKSKETFRGFRKKQGIIKRAASTAIYFLLNPHAMAVLHRLQADEIWHHYMGGPVKLYMIHPDGKLVEKILGKDIMNGEEQMVIVPANTWYGAHLLGDQDYWALIGNTVAPGFEWDDFEFGDRAELLREYPEHEELIYRLTNTSLITKMSPKAW